MRLIDADYLREQIQRNAESSYGLTRDVFVLMIKLLDVTGTVDAVEVVRCKDCKYFELDHWADLGGVKLITAHQICNKWSDGCMTDINGYCFLGERRQP